MSKYNPGIFNNGIMIYHPTGSTNSTGVYNKWTRISGNFTIEQESDVGFSADFEGGITASSPSNRFYSITSDLYFRPLANTTLSMILSSDGNLISSSYSEIETQGVGILPSLDFIHIYSTTRREIQKDGKIEVLLSSSVADVTIHTSTAKIKISQ